MRGKVSETVWTFGLWLSRQRSYPYPDVPSWRRNLERAENVARRRSLGSLLRAHCGRLARCGWLVSIAPVGVGVAAASIVCLVKGTGTMAALQSWPAPCETPFGRGSRT